MTKRDVFIGLELDQCKQYRAISNNNLFHETRFTVTPIQIYGWADFRGNKCTVGYPHKYWGSQHPVPCTVVKLRGVSTSAPPAEIWARPADCWANAAATIIWHLFLCWWVYRTHDSIVAFSWFLSCRFMCVNKQILNFSFVRWVQWQIKCTNFFRPELCPGPRCGAHYAPPDLGKRMGGDSFDLSPTLCPWWWYKTTYVYLWSSSSQTSNTVHHIVYR